MTLFEEQHKKSKFYKDQSFKKFRLELMSRHERQKESILATNVQWWFN